MELTRRSDLHPANPAVSYLAGLAPKGRRSIRNSLRTVARLFRQGDEFSAPWHLMRYAHVKLALNALRARGLAPATVNHHLAALRGVAKEAHQLGLLFRDELDRILAVKPVRGTRLPAGRHVQREEVEAVLAACSGPQALRDRALVHLLAQTGLRRSEVVSLDVEHLDASQSCICVLGKGDRERKVFVSGGALEAVKALAEARGSGPLFVRFDREGRETESRLSDAGVRYVLTDLCRRAGVEPFRPHDLRRTMIGEMLDHGVDLATVQAVAGHADPRTTARYDRRPDERKRAAARAIEW